MSLQCYVSTSKAPRTLSQRVRLESLPETVINVDARSLAASSATGVSLAVSLA